LKVPNHEPQAKGGLLIDDLSRLPVDVSDQAGEMPSGSLRIGLSEDGEGAGLIDPAVTDPKK